MNEQSQEQQPQANEQQPIPADAARVLQGARAIDALHAYYSQALEEQVRYRLAAENTTRQMGAALREKAKVEVQLRQEVQELSRMVEQLGARGERDEKLG